MYQCVVRSKLPSNWTALPSYFIPFLPSLSCLTALNLTHCSFKLLIYYQNCLSTNDCSSKSQHNQDNYLSNLGSDCKSFETVFWSHWRLKTWNSLRPSCSFLKVKVAQPAYFEDVETLRRVLFSHWQPYNFGFIHRFHWPVGSEPCSTFRGSLPFSNSTENSSDSE